MLHRLMFLTGCAFLMPLRVVLACQCPDAFGPPPCALFSRSNFVFIAQVMKIDQEADNFGVYPAGTLVHLSVEQVFKGKVDREILDYQGHEIDCQRVYKSGDRYLIYAQTYDKQTNTITTAPCFGRTQVSHAIEHLAYIRELSNHLARSSVRGRVLEYLTRPLPQVKISIQGMERTYETATDNEGRYDVVLDQPGDYVVTVVGQFDAALGIGAEKSAIGIYYDVKLRRGECDYRELKVVLPEERLSIINKLRFTNSDRGSQLCPRLLDYSQSVLWRSPFTALSRDQLNPESQSQRCQIDSIWSSMPAYPGMHEISQNRIYGFHTAFVGKNFTSGVLSKAMLNQSTNTRVFNASARSIAVNRRKNCR